MLGTKKCSSCFCVAGALALGCSTPAGKPAEVIFAIEMIPDPTPDPSAANCVPQSRLMIPTQESTLVITETTPDISIEMMLKAVNGEAGFGVKCEVRETAAGTFTVSLDWDDRDIDHFNLDAQIVNEFSTSGSLTWLRQGFQSNGGTCTLDVNRKSDGTPFIGEGAAKLTYACDPFLSSDNQSCVGQGTVYMNNCKE